MPSDGQAPAAYHGLTKQRKDTGFMCLFMVGLLTNRHCGGHLVNGLTRFRSAVNKGDGCQTMLCPKKHSASCCLHRSWQFRFLWAPASDMPGVGWHDVRVGNVALFWPCLPDPPRDPMDVDVM